MHERGGAHQQIQFLENIKKVRLWDLYIDGRRPSADTKLDFSSAENVVAVHFRFERRN